MAMTIKVALDKLMSHMWQPPSVRGVTTEVGKKITSNKDTVTRLSKDI